MHSQSHRHQRCQNSSVSRLPSRVQQPLAMLLTQRRRRGHCSGGVKACCTKRGGLGQEVDRPEISHFEKCEGFGNVFSNSYVASSVKTSLTATLPQAQRWRRTPKIRPCERASPDKLGASYGPARPLLQRTPRERIKSRAHLKRLPYNNCMVKGSCLPAAANLGDRALERCCPALPPGWRPLGWP